MLSSNNNNLAEKKNIANRIIDFITGLNNQTIKVTMIISFIIALINLSILNRYGFYAIFEAFKRAVKKKKINSIYTLRYILRPLRKKGLLIN
jgi:hypothetical protein